MPPDPFIEPTSSSQLRLPPAVAQVERQGSTGQSPAMHELYGGRYLTKGGSHRFPEGGHWKPERVVVIEFPEMQSLDRWYTSPEYQPLIALRKQCTSDLDMLIPLEGA